jgi:hypothetical protein
MTASRMSASLDGFLGPSSFFVLLFLRCRAKLASSVETDRRLRAHRDERLYSIERDSQWWLAGSELPWGAIGVHRRMLRSAIAKRRAWCQRIIRHEQRL